ncbi:Glutamate--tRNA ligase [Buchnera aphidicola (Periphyllus testudinaceus)]|uniref:glutamate--tRNA ligase n=1 Tax=Buchnera aphidicola TaxID=9 RepID=UPI003463FD6F
MVIKTRFAPSPTGELHFGNIRTALYSWLYARKNNGIFVLRIEDTDMFRSKNIFSKKIIKTLKWLKLNWDEGPYFQSTRIEHYKNIILMMLKKKIAYKCYCGKTKLNLIKEHQILKGEKPRYDGTCRNLNKNFTSLNKYVVRFKNPEYGKVFFNDSIRGKITFNNNELDDLIIQRENGIPTYNFCVVIDDMESNITHVIRGEDHINNTPRQINILNSLGSKIPSYAHLSMIVDSNRKVLSKRSDSAKVLEYKKFGYFPEAILNYIVRLGWSHKNKEIFSVKEMINLFNFNSITKSPSIFDKKKLLWLNKYYMNLKSEKKIKKIIFPFFYKNKIDFEINTKLNKILKTFSPHCSTVLELFNSIKFFYVKKNIKFNKEQIKIYLNKKSIYILEKLYNIFLKLIDWNEINILKSIKSLSLSLKVALKDVIIPIRISLIGKIHSLGINKILFFIGKKESLKRLKNFIKYLKIIFI